jgi:hypothetical protein
MLHGSTDNESAVTENPNRVVGITHQYDVYTKDPACELSDPLNK